MSIIISGIQQVGIGIPDVYDAWTWYRKYFGMDIPMFDEAAEANLMLPYTGGQPQQRHAILAYNIQGGGGMEIWQYKSRTPQAPGFNPLLGDLGIHITKIKAKDPEQVLSQFQNQKLDLIHSTIQTSPDQQAHFMLRDPYGNIFQVIQWDDWFIQNNLPTGGPVGCLIGVSDIDKSLTLYRDILGYDKVIYDERGEFEDLKALSGGENRFRRVLLTHLEPRKGPFSKFFGKSTIELIQVLDRSPQKIFENRFWADLGFIHLCFDIQGMHELKQHCETQGFPFTVDSSNSFDMGEAAGHFSYIEDPDGTLIEFVETHKIPIIKKIGWFLDLRKRNPEKTLPNWMIQSLSFNRVKA